MTAAIYVIVLIFLDLSMSGVFIMPYTVGYVLFNVERLQTFY